MNHSNCTHTDEERCVVGTCVVDEVHKAIEMGNVLVNVFVFWEYKETCFDKGTNSGELFAECVIMLLKLKQESSGYPTWVQSDADKDK